VGTGPDGLGVAAVTDALGVGAVPDALGLGLGDRVGRPAWSLDASWVISGESGASACGLSAR
jgi:hypothetical protein